MIPGLGFGGYSPALRAYGLTQQGIADSIERLSTGQRINRGKDDPSGLQAVSQFDADIAKLEGTIKGLERENHWLAAREGGFAALSDLVIELQGAVVSAANTGGRSDAELEALQLDVDGILAGMEDVLLTGTFNGQRLFSETLQSFGSVDGISDDSDADDLRWTLANMKSGGALSLTSGNLEQTQELVDGAVGMVAGQRATIGAKMNANASEIAAKAAELEALTGVRSGIEDTDFAAETANLVRNQILQQAQLASMQIGNQNAGAVLALIDSATPGNSGGRAQS
ncbi:MAG: flagellin [Phycisphaerales bacterium]